MVREGVCQETKDKIKEVFDGVYICDDKILFVSFILSNKKVINEEMVRLSNTYKKFVPLVKACKFIKKQLNREMPDLDSFIYY
ncbi:uncharacterized protein VNE69_01047 [Vairimorpha necatrix]|uniref:Uncharacterized protein n=1 Tax=Vairimorpha necatrix TaxID=6039 RepID=A0AAX4J849_9MICR